MINTIMDILYRPSYSRRKLQLWLVTDYVHGGVAASFPSLHKMEINSSITSRHFSFIQIILFPIQQAYLTKLAQMYSSFHITFQAIVTQIFLTDSSSYILYVFQTINKSLSAAIPMDKLTGIINIIEDKIFYSKNNKTCFYRNYICFGCSR
jgi:hypothetical protein